MGIIVKSEEILNISESFIFVSDVFFVPVLLLDISIMILVIMRYMGIVFIVSFILGMSR